MPARIWLRRFGTEPAGGPDGVGPACVARSRIVARSGSRPMYQKIAEIVKYVLMAKKSQTSGERKLIHRGPRVFGYGNTQNASHGRPMWISGNRPAHMTANSVIASAARLTEVR